MTVEHTDYDDRTEQAITLNLPDLINHCLEQAGDDIDGNTEVTLTVNTGGHSDEYQRGVDFDLTHIGIFAPVLKATADYDDAAQVILTITNMDRKLR